MFDARLLAEHGYLRRAAMLLCARITHKFFYNRRFYKMENDARMNCQIFISIIFHYRRVLLRATSLAPWAISGGVHEISPIYRYPLNFHDITGCSWNCLYLFNTVHRLLWCQVSQKNLTVFYNGFHNNSPNVLTIFAARRATKEETARFSESCNFSLSFWRNNC